MSEAINSAAGGELGAAATPKSPHALSALARGLARQREALRAYALVGPAFLVAAVLLLLPACALVALSFATQNYFELDYTPTLANYHAIVQPAAEPTYYFGIPFYLESPIYLILLVKSVLIAAVATVAVVLLAYPMAYFLSFRVKMFKFAWIVLITLPFWTSYLLRIFSWKIILGYDGLVNSGLKSLGLISKPLEFLLYSPEAVVITLAHSWAAFAILPIFVSLEKIDRSLLEASMDLGDTPFKRFFRVILPLSLPGVTAAFLLVFIPTVGDYATPTLVGGREGMMISNIVQSQFGKANNAPLGAALSVVSMLVVAAIAALYLWSTTRRQAPAKEAR